MLNGFFAAGRTGARIALAAGLVAAGMSAAAAQGVLRPGGAVPPPGAAVPPGNPGDQPSTRDQGPALGGDLISADDQNLLLQELQSLGYNATLTRDSVGDPKIDGKMSRSPYHIYFYGCTNNEHCKYIQFVAGWDLTDGISLEKINDWNRDKLWGQAYRDDENDPWISVVYNLDGGVTKANFADTVDWFRITLEAFEKHIGWTQ